MQVVIEIPEELYQAYKGRPPMLGDAGMDMIAQSIANGTPLPKGHGRIMDVDKIIKKMEEREEQLKDNRSMYETACVETALDMFGETIIPAEQEVD